MKKIRLITKYQDTRSNNEDFALTPFLFSVLMRGKIIKIYGIGLCWGYWSRYFAIGINVPDNWRVQESPVLKDATELGKGVIYVPYVLSTKSTSINGEVVWYKNKWRNLLLKIRHFFFKPKCYNNMNRYSEKPIDASNYGVIKIENKDK